MDNVNYLNSLLNLGNCCFKTFILYKNIREFIGSRKHSSDIKNKVFDCLNQSLKGGIGLFLIKYVHRITT